MTGQREVDHLLTQTPRFFSPKLYLCPIPFLPSHRSDQIVHTLLGSEYSSASNFLALFPIFLPNPSFPDLLLITWQKFPFTCLFFHELFGPPFYSQETAKLGFKPKSELFQSSPCPPPRDALYHSNLCFLVALL